MCMEDIRIGRQTGPLAKVTDVPGASDTVFLDANPDRITFTVSACGVTPVVIWPASGVTSLGFGIMLSLETPVRTITVEDVGVAIIQRWFAGGVGGGSTVACIEGNLERK